MRLTFLVQIRLFAAINRFQMIWSDQAKPGRIIMQRRTFLASVAIVPLSGCVHCRLPAVREDFIPVSDAHGHFFNASDLPVGNFIKYCAIPGLLTKPDGSELPLPDWALALIDIFGWVAKRLAVSASSEIRRFGRGELFGDSTPGTDEFGKQVARRQQDQIGTRSARDQLPGNPQTDLGDSHYALARLLGALQPARSGGKDPGNGEIVDASVYSDIATNGAIAGLEPGKPLERARLLGSEPMLDPLNYDREDISSQEVDAAKVKTMLRWAYEMCLPRCTHVEHYEKTISHENFGIEHVVNLMVDYGKWLGEEPAPGSSYEEQVRLWTRYDDWTSIQSSAIRLHTFVGFDPLRHLEEQLEGIPSSFATMKEWALAGKRSDKDSTHRITGFKFYPPMGFKPAGNPDRYEFPVPSSKHYARAEQEVQNRWRERGWNTQTQLGPGLERAMEEALDFCAQQDVPVFAHSYPSVGSMKGAQWNALPQYWVDAARGAHLRNSGKRLTACIGHFDPWQYSTAFADAIAENEAGRANIFFDFGYDPRILHDSAGSLLYQLERLCRNNSGEEYVMFGTDWIMLGQETTAGSYLKNFLEALDANNFWSARRQKILGENLKRFLGLSTAVLPQR